VRFSYAILGYDFVSMSGMGWNLFLALVPLLMAVVLFRVGRRPGLLWWVGMVAFVLFLPNSAYVLTDVVQLIRRIRQTPYVPVWTVALVLIPQYGLFMLAGFEAHVLAIMRLGNYLRWLGYSRRVVPVELALNFAVAVGIYLGRFRRFNSWDVLHDPMRLGLQTIDDFTTARPLQIVAIGFGVLSVLYYAVMAIDRALAVSWQAWTNPPQA
jgi:uncharacterized membrane protein